MEIENVEIIIINNTNIITNGDSIIGYCLVSEQPAMNIFVVFISYLKTQYLGYQIALPLGF